MVASKVVPHDLLQCGGLQRSGRVALIDVSQNLDVVPNVKSGLGLKVETFKVKDFQPQRFRVSKLSRFRISKPRRFRV